MQEIPRFKSIVIKSDKEVEEFRNRIYTKIKRVTILYLIKDGLIVTVFKVKEKGDVWWFSF